MKYRFLLPLATVIAVLTAASFLFVLFGVPGNVYLSPDENATAISAQVMADTGSFAIQDPILQAYPWLHPRSFVTFGNALVPVGFLGMPLVTAALLKLTGTAGMALFTPILVLTCLIPLWSAARRWGRPAQVAAVISWLTFPTVLLYANRGLFANLPVVCLAIWSVWFVWKWRSRTASVIAGLLAGLALLLRPTEAIWVLPWILTAYVSRDVKRNELKTHIGHAILFFIPLLAVAAIGAFLAWKTYGSPFVIGYQLRDPSTVAATTSAVSQRVSWFESWPFGFHPRNVWFNVSSYLIGFLLPWTAIFVAAGALAWRERKNRLWILCASWTVGILCIVYGQGIYQDTVTPNAATLGNSFLRYILPVSAIAAVSVAWFCGWLSKGLKRYGTGLAILCVFLLAALGIWNATIRDEEGLAQDRIELERYATIRSDASAVLPDDSVVFSDRSDKIFFPLWRAASPMPSADLIRSFASSTGVTVAVFLRTTESSKLGAMTRDGGIPDSVLDAGNESLYILY